MKIFWQNVILRKILVIFFSAISILATAGSCSGQLINQNQNVYGVLKKDPEVREEGFVKANAVRTVNGEVANQGLTSLSVLKISQIDSDNLYSLTNEKGLFKTTNAGVLWERLYILPVGEGEQAEQDIALNDEIRIVDFDVDNRTGKVIYVAAVKDKVSKIYQSLDGGITFKEIFTEVQNKDDIGLIRIDPVNNANIFAVIEEGALIRSQDAGLTWQKVRSFKDKPVDMGFVPEFGEIFYVLFEDEGLAISTDGGLNFDLKELSKSSSQIGERQPSDSLDISFKEDVTFGKYEEIVPVTAGIIYNYDTNRIINADANQPWILIADRQIWFSENVEEDFNKLILPSQAEQYDLYDATFDPVSGLSKIYVSIDDKLFTTTNQGRSWNTQEKINIVDGQIGNIGQILIDKENPQIIYLTLLDPKARRDSGFFSL